MTPKELRGKVAIVGASESDVIGFRPDVSDLGLHAEAASNALRESGLTKDDVEEIKVLEELEVQEEKADERRGGKDADTESFPSPIDMPPAGDQG